MKHSQLQTDNQFDTLRLHIPENVITAPKWENFQYIQTYNTATGISTKSKSVTEHKLITEHKGIDLAYIDGKGYYDCTISAKLLRDEYHKGIGVNTIARVGTELISAGLSDVDIDMSEFIQHTKVLRADNTFNIKVDENDIQSYYDSLELVISQGKRGKIQTYDSQFTETCNGVVVGKDTRKLQKITIYNKIDEARSLLKKKYPLLNIADSVEKEYGMKYDEFNSYFADRLRVELRVNDFNKLRKLYTNKSRGEVMLEDLLFSKNNAILYQWRQFVSDKQSQTAIKFIDMSMEDKKNYKLGGFNSYANWQALKEWVNTFEGDEKLVKEKIQKIFYTTPTGYKKISPTVANDITRFCSEYRLNKQKSKRGELFTSNLTERYKEIDKKITKL